MAYRVALRLTGNHHDAQDLAQEALIAAWEKLDQFRGEASFSTWLYQIVTRRALNKVAGDRVRLGKPLAGPGVTTAEAVAAIDFVLSALELIDSRIADWKITPPDTIADNGSSGGLVLGSRPVKPEKLDLSLTGCLLHRNGRLVDTGAGGAVPGGSPVNALVWLVNILGERGASLEAGHVVLSGSVTAAIPVYPGDTISAAFDRIGTVSISFSDPSAQEGK
jgi:2-keto-4-pentenoate hydratase